ncbi:MAG TPA: malonyl-ACP O-methyltransferase BioC [Rheinheimera sp.]|nr:malonyl-ACP O-methyltransferase BioC [Rheinheimera sp.]
MNQLAVCLTTSKVAEQPQIQQVARRFGLASETYTAAARLQQQVALNALQHVPADNAGRLLDLGCGPGWIHPRLSQLCQQFIALDLSAGMLAKAAEQNLAAQYVLANADAIPLADNSLDKIFSSLMLQWCPKPVQVFSELRRLLKPGGKLVITTLVQGTLHELKQAFSCLDDAQHVNDFLLADDVIAAAKQVSDINWQFECRSYPLYYQSVLCLARELKALGANQVLGQKRRGLTGKAYWQALADAYEPKRSVLGLPATYQVLTITGVKQIAV